MRYIQESGITNKSVSGDRGAYGFLKRSFPKGALTHHRLHCKAMRVGWCTACGSRALYEVTMITWLKEPTDFYLTSKFERSK